MSRRSGRLAGAVLGAAVGLTGLGLLGPSTASAHPLGNFTINHYTGLRVRADVVLLDHVVDMAEIPTFQERQSIDTDGDGTVSATEAATYERSACDRTASQLRLTVEGQAAPLSLTAAGLRFPAGQGGLLTMRLVCEYRAVLPIAITTPAAVAFADTTYPARIGWREVVVLGDGMTIRQAPGEGATPASVSLSGRLTHYPTDLLSQPLDVAAVAFVAAPGGPAAPVFVAPDASRPAVGSAATPSGSTASAGGDAAGAMGSGVPGGIGALASEVEQAIRSGHAGLPLLALAFLLAAGLGAAHAVQPGHGKTIMAAYLVGARGRASQALLLGLAVTISHTLNVLALGAIVLYGASVLPPELVFPVLGVVSGLTVVGLGLFLLADRWRVRRAGRARNGALGPAVVGAADRPDHHHDHGPRDEGSEADRDRPSGDDRSGDTDSWHRHGGVRHHHPAPEEGAGSGSRVGWRTLVVLGLAGGLVPAPEALFLLLIAIAAGKVGLGLALIVTFGLGMAAVMVGLGMALVYARGVLDRLSIRRLRMPGGGLLPTASAVTVVVAGLYLTSQALGQVRF